MKSLPPIGSRVRYPGGAATSACTGKVLRHHKEFVYPEDADWESDDRIDPVGLAPPEEWHVAIEVDELPERWPYGGNDGKGRVFAPCVKDLTPA